jgi:hypothetical protein
MNTRTKSFEFFCTLAEFSHSLNAVMPEFPNASLLVEESGSDWQLKRLGFAEADLGAYDHVWVNALHDIPDNFLGLVRIGIPKLTPNELQNASIAIKYYYNVAGHSDGVRFYDRCRKELKKSFKPGLWGINMLTGAEKFYRDLYISDGAIQESISGRRLVPEGGGGFVKFEYR